MMNIIEDKKSILYSRLEKDKLCKYNYEITEYMTYKSGDDRLNRIITSSAAAYV